MTSEAIDRGFAILRLVLDPLRNETVPVGAAAWDPSRDWFDVRIIGPDQRLKGVDKSARRIVEYNASQLRRWASEQYVPYAKRGLDPTRTTFWNAVSDVLTSSILLDPPKAMEPLTSEDEFEALFEAVVQPEEPRGKRAARADSALTRALGEVADEIPRRVEVRAFQQRREKVHRAAKGRDGLFIVESVNLAAKNARDDADALVSRLLRILEAEGRDRTSVLIGYRASPGGLNGEGDLRDWMIESITPDVYDVTRQAELLKETALDKLRKIGPSDDTDLRLF